jgi:hypothetical protein
MTDRMGREGPATAMPVIVGAPRSGTTLLRFMLDAHPQLAIPPETAFLRLAPELVERRVTGEEFAQTIIGFPESAPAWADFGIDEYEFRSALGRLSPFTVADGFRSFYRLYAARFGKSRWGDKTPLYCKAIGPIRDILPEARFIHIIRDGRDAALSLRRMWFSPGEDVEAQAQYWRECVSSARDAGLGRSDYLEVRYEELVEQPVRTLKEVCRFIALEFDDGMLGYHRRAPERLQEHGTRLRADGTPLVTREQRLAQVARTMTPPDTSRAGVWRTEMPAAEQHRFAAVAGDLLEELGYGR